MKKGDIVLVTLHEPREQIWGLLLRIKSSGAFIRGIDARNFEEWARELTTEHEPQLGLSTLYFPTHRIERISLDEKIGVVPSMKGRFQEITSMDAMEVLNPEKS